MKNVLPLGYYLKQKRLALNLTMERVAKDAGITRASLSALENGSLKCSLSNLYKVLKILDMNLYVEGNCKNKSTRNRATRTNTVLDKKINRFIVMCVEQYAAFVNEDSKVIYNKLFKKGIIEDLKNDYEDLHGMSTLYINEYIGALI